MYYNEVNKRKVALWTRKTTTPTGLQYEEGEYIYNSASNYIDLGVEPTIDTMVQLKFKPTNATGDVIIGTYKNSLISDFNDWRLFNYGSSIYLDLPCDGSATSGLRIYGGSCRANITYEFEVGNYYVKKVGASSNLISGVKQTKFNEPAGNLWIEKADYADSAYARAYWYYIKIYQGNTLIRDFIPAKLTADCTAEKCNLGTAQKSGAIGLYDKVNDMFYANSNTSGAFIFGAKS